MGEAFMVGTGVTAEGDAFEILQPKQYEVVEIDIRNEGDEKAKVSSGEFDAPPQVIFVCGGPGSGKGTNCTRLKDEFGFIHLSTGDLLRAEVKGETKLGLQLKSIMQEGKLVPDEISIGLLKNAMLENQDCNRFLIDGFPRSVKQAIAFEKDVAEAAMVLNFDCSPETMTERIMERGKTSGRSDDNAETIKKRLDTFFEQTAPVVDYYKPIGKLRSVDAS